MPDGTQPPPPPPAPVYQPVSPQPASVGVRLPAWLELWGLIGLVIIFVGAIVVLVGFLDGNAYASCLSPGSGCTVSSAASDLQGFFTWTGAGIFLVVLGWIFRVFMGQWRASKSAAASASTAPTTTTTAAAPAPAPTPPPAAPVAAPTTPACANCGKPTTYIAQYGRYYCYSCARYV